MDTRLTLAALAWFALLTTALAPLLRRKTTEGTAWRWTFALFLTLLAVNLLLWRWRSITYNGEINVDESQILSQAMRYLEDPIPWRSVDGGSSGPLNTWVLMWAPMVGLNLDYFAARITSVLCLWSLFFALSLALVEISGRRLALMLLLPALTFVETTTNFDFAFLSSEQLPSALSAWIIYLMARQLRAPSRWAVYIIGLLAGALPFTKIQVGPAALFLFAIAMFITLFRDRFSRKAASYLLIQFIGGITVPLLILVPVAFAGAWRQFFSFYILSAISYKNSGDLMQKMDVSALIFSIREFGVFFICCFILVLSSIAFSTVFDKERKELRQYAFLILFSFAYLTFVAASILRTGYPFPHYLMLMVVPLVFMVGVSVRPVQRVVEQGAWGIVDFTKQAALPLVLMLGGAVCAQACATIADLRKNPRLMEDWGPGIHPVTEVIRSLVKPGDRIAVWGWAPKLYVMSQTRPAYRFPQSIFLLAPSHAPDPIRDLYFESFLSDLQKEKPKLFIDAPDEFVWPGYPQGVLARHWALPIVSQFVRENYSLVRNFDSLPGKSSILIYRLKDTVQPQNP